MSTEIKPQLTLVDGTPAAPGAAAKANALAEENRDVLEQLVRWAVERRKTEATHVLMCIAVESWVCLAEHLMPPDEVQRLRDMSAVRGGTAMACGFQPRERIVALMLEHYGMDIAPMLDSPRRRPGEWPVVICFEGGMALGGIPGGYAGDRCNAPGGAA